MRVGSLNVSAMTGKGREIADLMVRRKMNVCVQESGWRGGNARELGDGCKLIYSRANKELEWSGFREQMIRKRLSNCAFKGKKYQYRECKCSTGWMQ